MDQIYCTWYSWILYLIKHTEKLDFKIGNATEELIENKAVDEKFARVV